MHLLSAILPSRRRVPAVVIRSTRAFPGLQRIVLGGPDLSDWRGLDGVTAPTAWPDRGRRQPWVAVIRLAISVQPHALWWPCSATMRPPIR